MTDNILGNSMSTRFMSEFPKFKPFTLFGYSSRSLILFEILDKFIIMFGFFNSFDIKDHEKELEQLNRRFWIWASHEREKS